MSQTNPVVMPKAASVRSQQHAKLKRMTAVLVWLLLATPAVAFWLWLIIGPARLATLCPNECDCDRNGIFIACRNTSLTAVPPIPLTQVRVLELFLNNITLLKKNDFVSLIEMDVLYILTCGLREIEAGAFNGLAKLTELSLWDNELSELIPGTFDGLNSLEVLGLSQNRLEHLDGAVFSGLFNLQYIVMGENKLQYVHPDTFLGLPKLKQIYLTGNSDLHIPTDRNFINSHSLKELDLSLCNVTSLSVETFANVSALDWIDLSGNNLITVDINILKALPELSTMYLYDNPLQCDCQLQEVWRWCKDRKILTASAKTAPQCDTPSEVEEIWWGVLEKGQCLEGNIQYYGDYSNTTYSETDLEYKKYIDRGFSNQYQILVYAFPCIFGTISNVILLLIIICNKDMRTVPNMYILNLAIGDIIYLMLLFSEVCANKVSNTWLESDFWCTFFSFGRRLSIGLSAYSVAVFSFQRYRVIVYPFKVRISAQAAWCVTVATIFGVWIVAALFAVPSALSKYFCRGLLRPKHHSYYQLVVIFELLVSCVLPLCVVLFSYIMMARHLVLSSRSISEGTENPQHKKRRNTAKIVLGLAFVFMISYVPYHIIWTSVVYSGKESFLHNINVLLNNSLSKVQYMNLIAIAFVLVNPCLNPVALFCTSSPIRKHLKRHLICFWNTDSPPTVHERARRR